jgi:hypothetical protein
MIFTVLAAPLSFDEIESVVVAVAVMSAAETVVTPDTARIFILSG